MFNATTLPVKLAVLPASSKLTVKLLVVTLLDILAKFAVSKLPAFVFNATTLPVKLAVLPASSKLTVRLLVIVFALTLRLFPTIFAFADIKLASRVPVTLILEFALTLLANTFALAYK